VIDIARWMDDPRLSRVESHSVGCSTDLLILTNLITDSALLRASACSVSPIPNSED
jgi:hypothetical protein